MIDLNTSIVGAPNFKYKEFVKSYEAVRHGIVNIPNSSQWKLIEVLAINILQPVRNKFGAIRISSGFRCLELNRLLKSNDNSLHAIGAAVDIEPLDDKVELFDVLLWIHNNCEYRELIAENFDAGGWIHIGYVEGWNTRKLKIKDLYHNYVRTTIEYFKCLYG